MPIQTFKVRKYLPPEMRNLPLNLKASQNWPLWPHRVVKGLEQYPSRMPLTMLQHGNLNALGAMQVIADAHAKLVAQAAATAVANTPDQHTRRIIEDATMAAMEQNRSDRRHVTEIWSQRRAMRQFEESGFGWPTDAFAAYQGARRR